MGNKDRDYLLARAGQEQARAEGAPDEGVRDVHRKLAREYFKRANLDRVEIKSDSDVLGFNSGDGAFSPIELDPQPSLPPRSSDLQSQEPLQD